MNSFGKMADKKISEESIEKKLSSLNSSQDSVQAASLWIMHNKAHHQKIVDTWLKVLKRSDVKHKLTLFYLCNDVVQHAKRKKALYYLENFKDNLREAVYVIREHDSIKPNVGRVFKIWEERRTYDLKFVKELRGLLDGTGGGSRSSSAKSTPAQSGTPAQSSTPVQASPASYKPSSKRDSRHKHKHKRDHIGKQKEPSPVPKASDETKLEEDMTLGNFKPPVFLDEMSSLRKLEGEVTLKAKQLASLRIDATNIEAIKQLKDRSHGNEFCRQFEESCVKIEDYVAMLEQEIRQRKAVLSNSDGAEDFYSEQYKEASIVANAYKNFGARVTNMKKRVDDMKKIIPATPSPMPSPTADAPSPSNSPSAAMLNIDDNETVDMEICNDDTENTATVGKQGWQYKKSSRRYSRDLDVGPAGGRAYTAMVKSISQPITSLTHIVMGSRAENESKKAEPAVVQGVPPPTDTFQGSNILESRIATMLPSLSRGSSSIGSSSAPPPSFSRVPGPEPASEQPVAYSPSHTDPGAPQDDAGSSTPVMDEPEEDKSQPSPPHSIKSTASSKISDAKTKTNPIDFLSQLLTKSKTSSSSSNFMQTLSLLTNTVKSNYEKQQVETVASNGDLGPPDKPAVEEARSPSPRQESPPSPGDWSNWKSVPPNQSQPPLPAEDPSSPPVIGQVKPSKPPPPLPPEPLPPQPFSVPPPSQPDFSLPPPAVAQAVSQGFVSPPPIASSTNPFAASLASVASATAPFSQSVTASAVPTMVSAPRPNLGFSSRYSFLSGPPPAVPAPGPVPPSPDHAPIRPGFPLPPPAQTNMPGPPNYIPAAGVNRWEQPGAIRLPSVPPSVPPVPSVPQSPSTFPPRPPASIAATNIASNPPPNWPPPPLPMAHQTRPVQPIQSLQQPTTPIHTEPTNWQAGQHTNMQQPEYNQQASWESAESVDSGGGDPGGYHHPWDEPQTYDDEEEENEYEPAHTVNPLPPPPKKSILRNNRTSSLREVTLVDESSATNTFNRNQDSNIHNTVVTPEVMKPAGILKKPPMDFNPGAQTADVQSEFINILKQKSGSNLPNAPPSTRTLTSISTVDTFSNIDEKGETISSISSIGVVGSSGQGSMIMSDDMEIDNDEQPVEAESSQGGWEPQGGNDNSWQDRHDDNAHRMRHDDPGPRRWENQSGHHNNHRAFPYEARKDERPPHGDFRRRDSHPDNDYHPRPRWPAEPQRHRPPRPGYGGQDGFRPRPNYPPPRPYQDNHRGGPSPAKRPFYSPRGPRPPYYRY